MAKYSRQVHNSYNREKHMELKDAYSMIDENGLDKSKLEIAIREKEIQSYEFKGKIFVDRLDLGRLYHQPKENHPKLSIDRYFSKEGVDPFDTVGPYTKRDLIRKDKDGNVIFEMEGAEFPESWDDNDALTVADKYFFKPDKENWKQVLREKLSREHEYSIKHLISRVVNFVADAGMRLGYFKTEEDRDIFADELKTLQLQRKFAFNSPVQFNAGLFLDYGIKGSNGINFWTDPETGDLIRLKNAEYEIPQCHACFIQGPFDDLESILDHGKDEGAVFSLGSGIGQDIGALRGENEPLSGGGKSSGSISFLIIYDTIAGSIKSGGKTRRAARMTCMRYHHPDIEEFITIKVKEDHKTKVLLEAGYSGGMDGEAASTVALQNTNLSVRLDDDFFMQLKEGKKIELRRVTDNSVVKSIPADEMLKQIAFGAWRVGDPGVQYESKIQEYNTCKNSGRINASNPCSEFMHLDSTACNLNSHNILAYCDDRGNFNIEDFKKGVLLTSIAADILNHAASYPVKDIAIISPEFGSIGIGHANIGTFLMRLGVPYDSDKGRSIAGAITAIMTGTAYETSAELAEKLDPFVHYELNKRSMEEVLEKHQANLDNQEFINWDLVPKEFKNEAYKSWKNAISKGKKHGFRNAQVSLLAPTGTISYLMGCDSTGIEPSYSLKVIKSIAGGGTLELKIREIPKALRNLGYDEVQIKDIQNYIDEHNSFKGAPHMLPKHYRVFDTAIGNGKGEGVISIDGHLKMLAATQPFLSGAISKTVNLPKSATVKDFYNAIIKGHDLGIKALAAFRQSSKSTMALGFDDKSIKKLKRGETEDIPYKRPSLEEEVKLSGVPIHLIVSEYPDGRPAQIAFLSLEGSTMGALLKNAGIQASAALKRGVHIDDMLKGWLGWEFEPKGMVQGHPYIKQAKSFLDLAAKIILLEYRGNTDLAENKNGLKKSELQGAKNGAFRTYRRMNIDPWDFNQVMNDAELGGFAEKTDYDEYYHPENGKLKEHGELCQNCGSMLTQTKPGCFTCTCGEYLGGCGP